MTGIIVRVCQLTVLSNIPIIRVILIFTLLNIFIGRLNMTKQAARKVLEQYWDKQFPVDIFSIASQMGVQVKYLDVLSAYSGKYQMENGIPTCYVDKLDTIERQRFTLAHEIGHHLHNHGESFRDTNETMSCWTPKERVANMFAAEVLMPKAYVDFLIQQKKITHPLTLAEFFKVSPAAMKIRLKETGWL